jgi:hypothetical protein
LGWFSTRFVIVSLNQSFLYSQWKDGCH